MKITFKVCFLLGSDTQVKRKLKRGHIMGKNFSGGTEEISIFFQWHRRDSLKLYIVTITKKLIAKKEKPCRKGMDRNNILVNQ
jgi:hypothetical protein